MELIRKGTTDMIQRNKEGALEYLTFPALTQTGMVEHLFTTRLGGVSEGIFATMNLSDSRGDSGEAVAENYRRIAAVLGCQVEAMVLSQQTHTTNIRVVTRADAGKGVVRERDYDQVDGLVTQEPGIALVTFYADCVPLFFVDPVHRAIGLSHSGWRGTVGRMAAETVRKMKEMFGTDPADVTAAIGPSICQDCYEVSEDVIELFREAFPERTIQEKLFCQKANGKYQLNLWEANRQVMVETGIPKDWITVTDVCTCCNPEYLFSHRASNGKRGNLAAFLMIK